MHICDVAKAFQKSMITVLLSEIKVRSLMFKTLVQTSLALLKDNSVSKKKMQHAGPTVK